MNRFVRIMLILACLLYSGSASHAGKLNVFTTDSRGFDTHTFWYDDGEEITVIDTQFVPELAQRVVDHIKSKSKSPITRVVITHPNPDKFNGLSVLHALGATSIASLATAKAMPDVHKYKKYFFVNIAEKFTEATYPKLEPVMQTFNQALKITLKSGETLSLFELQNSGISSNQTVIRIDATGDLLVGDLVHYKAHAWLEGGIIDGKPSPDLESWRKALDELKAIEGVRKVFGGRGEFVDVSTAVTAQKKYLMTVEQITRTYIDNLGNKKSEILDPAKSSLHHEKLQELISKAFPDYKLPYMITYGIYGLTQKMTFAKM